MRCAAGVYALLSLAWLIPFIARQTGLAHGVPDTVTGPAVWVVATFVGGFVAKHRFVPFAVLAWATVWGLILFTLYSIAAPLGQASLPRLLQYNAVALAATLAANITGAVLGQLAARSASRPNNSSKPTPLRGAA
jgi:hypothetical protein